MKKLLLLAALASFGFALQSHAQDVDWDTSQNMVGDTDVSNVGAPVDAVTTYGSPITLNGVTFNSVSGANTSGGVSSDGIISIANSGNGSPGAYGFAYNNPSAGNPTTLSTDYNDLTSVIAFGYYGNGTVTISDLTPGDTYQVQAWSYYSVGAGNNPAADTTYTGDNSVVLSATTGQFAIGTFTPATSTETFGYNFGANGGSYDVINAVSVREVSASVPEPATFGMLAGGLGLLLAGQRIRRRIRS